MKLLGGGVEGCGVKLMGEGVEALPVSGWPTSPLVKLGSNQPKQQTNDGINPGNNKLYEKFLNICLPISTFSVRVSFNITSIISVRVKATNNT